MRKHFESSRNLMEIVADRHFDTCTDVPNSELRLKIETKAFELAEKGDTYDAAMLMVVASLS